MAVEPLSTPLSIAINNSFKYNIFPSDAKIIFELMAHELK